MTDTREWVRFARMASQGANVISLVARGKLPPSMLWIGLEGAAEYITAIASGDVCDTQTLEQRNATCRACPSRTPVLGHPTYVGYCGTPLTPRGMDGPVHSRTCGCLRDAANAVASKPCPQEQFVAVTVDAAGK